MAIRRHAAGSIVVLDLSLVLGFLISQALTGLLAIECKGEEVPTEQASAVDEEALARVDEEWRAYIDHVVAMGYHGVFVGGFPEYVWLLAAGGAAALIGGLLAIGRRRRLADGVAVGA